MQKKAANQDDGVIVISTFVALFVLIALGMSMVG
jgi:hypothetical protein